MNLLRHERCADLMLSCWQATRSWDRVAHTAMNTALSMMVLKFDQERGDKGNPYSQPINFTRHRIYRDEVAEAVDIIKNLLAASYSETARRRALFRLLDRASTATRKAISRGR